MDGIEYNPICDGSLEENVTVKNNNLISINNCNNNYNNHTDVYLEGELSVTRVYCYNNYLYLYTEEYKSSEKVFNNIMFVMIRKILFVADITCNDILKQQL